MSHKEVQPMLASDMRPDRREFIKSAVFGTGCLFVPAWLLNSGDIGLEEAVKGERMQSITSKDGTRIAYWRSGAGPPLLLVHGMVADHSTTWRLVRPMLEKHFTVLAMDRRGRGGSGDGPGYELQQEAEDIVAIVASIQQPVNLLGHSYGGLCALEAALLSANIRRLIIYEGALLRGAELFSASAADRLEAMIDAGNVEGMLLTFLRDEVHIPPDEIELLRARRDAWDVRLRNAPTVPREVRETQRYIFDAERFSRLETPTLLLVGENSPSLELENATIVADALPNASVAILQEQQHLAMYTAPGLFVDEIIRFLEK
jgi:pimeloyl-ACP methyl ester carboxylesterase